jgi:hypothetical protein
MDSSNKTTDEKQTCKYKQSEFQNRRRKQMRICQKPMLALQTRPPTGIELAPSSQHPEQHTRHKLHLRDSDFDKKPRHIKTKNILGITN